MPLIDEVRDRITKQYNEDIDALKASADIISAHERASKEVGIPAIVSVCIGKVFVYLYDPRENGMEYVKKYNGAYFDMIGNSPAFLCDVNGDSVFILGK